MCTFILLFIEVDGDMNRTVVFVTGNANKLKELTQILGKDFPYKVCDLSNS